MREERLYGITPTEEAQKNKDLPPVEWIWGNTAYDPIGNPMSTPTCPTCGDVTYGHANCPACGQPFKVCFHCAYCSEKYPSMVDVCDLNNKTLENVYSQYCEKFKTLGD